LQKDFGFRRTQITSRTPSFRPRERGVSRSSRTLGTECGGRGSVRRAGQTARGRMALFPSSLKLRRTGKKPVEAFGADGSSGRRSRVVLTPRRWCQVSRSDPRNDGGKRARSPGRARSKPLKPLRGESRLIPLGPVVITLVCLFHFAREAAGATGTRLSLRPLISRDDVRAKLGRIAPRECERMPRCCLTIESANPFSSSGRDRLCEKVAGRQWGVYAALACIVLQNSARRSASRSVAGLASGEAISATSVLSIGAKPSFAVKTRWSP
jgi:hypothetical protein